jgi:hypothetical protein
MSDAVEDVVYYTSTTRMRILGFAAAACAIAALLGAADIVFVERLKASGIGGVGWAVTGFLVLVFAFFAACAGLILSKSGRPEAAIEIRAEGYRDLRLGTKIVPWPAIKGIKIIDLVPADVRETGGIFHLKSLGFVLDNAGEYLDRKTMAPDWLKRFGEDKTRPAYLSLLTSLDADAETIIGVVTARARSLTIPIVDEAAGTVAAAR